MSNDYNFSLAFDDFDLDLIGLDSVDSPDFADAVSKFFAAQFANFGGKARVIVNEQDRTIDVKWSKGPNWQSPKDYVLNLLNRGKMSDALPLLWTLIHEQPADTDNYYNLGVVYSELGDYPKAIQLLEELLQRDPAHAHGLTALGVAQIRAGKLAFGEEALLKALRLQPADPWALRNLGGCYMKQDRFDEAVEMLERAVKAAPTDAQALVGVGQALEHVGRPEDADEYYERLIKQGGPSQLVEMAKERRTALAQATMRSKGGFRPDVMMYIAGALDKFKGMSANEVQSIGIEIALLGQRGLDINDAAQKYSLKSLPGKFSGIHLLAIMYAAFKQFAPDQDVGVDFSREYDAAHGLGL